MDLGPVGVSRTQLQLGGPSTPLYREGGGTPGTGIKNRVLVAENMLNGDLQAPGLGFPSHSPVEARRLMARSLSYSPLHPLLPGGAAPCCWGTDSIRLQK